MLLNKLSALGILDKEYEWFENYLSGRLQVIKFQGIVSNPEPIVTGIPQGSILGPLLFVLHVNNYQTHVNVVYLCMQTIQCYFVLEKLFTKLSRN